MTMWPGRTGDRPRATHAPRCRGAIVVALIVAALAPLSAAQSAKATSTSAMAREKALRAEWQQAEGEVPAATLQEARAIVRSYEAVVRNHPVSGYCDNALWQAAVLEADLFSRAGQESDRQKAISLFEFLAREYPASPLTGKATQEAKRLQATPGAASVDTAARTRTPKGQKQTAAATQEPTAPRSQKPPAGRTQETKAAEPKPPDARAPETKPGDSRAAEPKSTEPKGTEPAATEPKHEPAVSTIRQIKRTVLPEVVRVSIELDREVAYREERVENPARLLFDLPSTRASAAVVDVNWTFEDDVVRRIRVGRHPNQLTRVVLDLEGVSRYSVVTLANPYRIMIDCERKAGPLPALAPASAPQPSAPRPVAEPDPELPKIPPPAVTKSEPPAERGTSAAKDGRANAATDPPAPERAKKPETAKPAPERSGTADHNRVSMARQLGLGVSRVVIDPGHGGHDPGAEGAQMNESDIVLDIALRLEKLLTKQSGIDVLLTRRSDVFVPLEERTAMANREQADLFLSIHANASRNQKARGIETYYLNFATDPDAEAVAARENAASSRTMNNLPDIVKAIALNNKLDESKDLAGLVQTSMAKRLRPSNKSLRDLGVKKAPFVVLIGAAMPSVLAEVSFVTNKSEGRLLKSEAYRQRIAEALSDAISRYRKTLKSTDIIAHGDGR